MRVVRGRAPDPESDHAVTATLLEYVEDTGNSALRVWTPPKQVAFGRRDAANGRYPDARAAAIEHGYAPIERQVGGRAVAYSGETVAFAYAVSDDGSESVRARYRDVTRLVKQALQSIGVTVRRGEPDHTFCPGDHSLQNDGKIVGIAQRVRRNAALVGGCVVVTEHDERELATVLGPIYDALEVSFDRNTIGSVESAGGSGSPEDVLDAVVSTFLEDRDHETIHASELRPE